MNPFITVSQHEDSKENKKYNAMIMIETAYIYRYIISWCEYEILSTDNLPLRAPNVLNVLECVTPL